MSFVIDLGNRQQPYKITYHPYNDKTKTMSCVGYIVRVDTNKIYLSVDSDDLDVLDNDGFYVAIKYIKNIEKLYTFDITVTEGI